MSKHYEDLAGAQGRERRFRQRRYDAREFFQGEPPRLFFNELEYELRNISVSGSAGSARADELPAIDRAGVLRLVQRGKEIFRAPARRARSERQAGKFLDGFALERASFDLREIQRLNARAVAQSSLDLNAAQGVPAEYKAHCADVLAFVGAHCARIDRLFSGAEGRYAPVEREEIFRELLAAVEADWRALLLEGNRLSLAARGDKAATRRMKAYTEACVTPALMDGATWRRCYTKPMGYPGDYQIMNYMYDVKPEGAGLRAQFLHGLGLIAGRPIATRMRKLSDLIVEHFAQTPAADLRRIASIGCGPARELEPILADLDPRTRLRATLIDQEVDALEYAANRMRLEVQSGRLEIDAVNTTFKSMFDPGGIGALANQDVIYSLGLVDYFSPLLAAKFVSRAYDLVKPGGKVIVANAGDSPNGTYWVMEHVLDWTLYFRNVEEMQMLARESHDARVTVAADPLDAIYFLILEKPRAAPGV
jgi:SAM-dependent methyltransferase